MRPRITKAIKAFFAFACLISIGFLSNAMSVNKCNEIGRKQVENVLAAEPPAIGKTINWINESDLRIYTAEEAWGEPIGFKQRLIYVFDNKYIGQKEGFSDQTPWGYTYSFPYEFPFIIKQYYGWMATGLWGRGGIRLYLCIFGFSIEIKDFKTWVS